MGDRPEERWLRVTGKGRRTPTQQQVPQANSSVCCNVRTSGSRDSSTISNRRKEEPAARSGISLESDCVHVNFESFSPVVPAGRPTRLARPCGVPWRSQIFSPCRFSSASIFWLACGVWGSQPLNIFGWGSLLRVPNITLSNATMPG
jgi:hypothetical protein